MPSNPLNLPLLLKRILWDSSIAARDLGDAFDLGRAEAKRMDFVFLDRALIGLELMYATPSTEKPKPGFFNYLLKGKEKVSDAVLVKVGTYIPQHKVEGSLPNAVAAYTEDRNEVQMKMIGVMDEKGKPKAIIYYSDGKRIPRGPKNEELNTIPGNAQTAPSMVRI